MQQRRSMSSGLGLVTVALATACHSPGRYGYSPHYAPLSEEEDAAKSALPYDPALAERGRDAWKDKPISVFGVVKTRIQGDGGASYLTLSVRALEPKNLCSTSDEDSCRVTVGEREQALIHAQVKLDAEDDIGKRSVGAGSLLRVIGRVGDDVDPNDGAPVVRASYYRHWPRNFYATSPGPASREL
jgi:hypothetical protein